MFSILKYGRPFLSMVRFSAEGNDALPKRRQLCCSVQKGYYKKLCDYFTLSGLMGFHSKAKQQEVFGVFLSYGLLFLFKKRNMNMNIVLVIST